MNLTTMVGLLAATGTTIAFVPQVLQIIKTQDTKGISLFMYIIFTIGIVFWLTYGILLSDIPIIIANSVTLILAITILFLKIKNG
ncbi:MAG: SemiSWEET transporter [Bacteroidota bacterium]|nr:SemiSWEET transporter [Bacteroidota bacterium]